MTAIAGKTVLLTGASRGIGTFIARALALQGATVVGVSRSSEGLENICSEINNQGGTAFNIPFDITKLTELINLVDQVNQLVGGVDIVINNAAIEKFRPFQDYTAEDIESILTLNLQAPMQLTRLLLPDMIKRNSGHIVNIASGAGKKAAPFNSVYSASKAGLIMWSEAIRQELTDTNIEVSVVCPGCVNTGMFLALDIPAPSGAKITEPAELANIIIQAIKHNQKEVIVDSLSIKVFYALSQLSPEFGDSMIKKAGVIENNRNCAQKQMQTLTRIK